MFKKEVYIERRNRLKKELGAGVAVFMGNEEASYNYPANTYYFRQDSHFLYFFGLNHPGFTGVIDVDNDTDYLFGNDFDIEDIIWMGEQPSLADMAAEVGVVKTANLKELALFIAHAADEEQTMHILPPYRGKTMMELANLFGISVSEVKSMASTAFSISAIS